MEWVVKSSRALVYVGFLMFLLLAMGTLNGQTRNNQEVQPEFFTDHTEQITENPLTRSIMNKEVNRWDDDIWVFSTNNHERHPSMTYDFYQNERVFAAAEQWQGSTNHRDIVIKRSTNHGSTWLTTSENFYTVTGTASNPLKFPKIHQLSGSLIGMVYVKEITSNNWNIVFRRFNTDNLSNTVEYNVDTAAAKLTRPSICSDFLFVSHPWTPWTHVTYINSTASPRALMYKKSTDQGYSWELPQVLANISSSVFDGDLCTSMDIFGGLIAIAYIDRVGSYDAVKVIVSNDWGVTWSTPRIISSNNYHLRFPEIRVVNGSNIIVAFNLQYSPADNDVYFAYSTDSGNNFTNPVALANSTVTETNPSVSSYKTGSGGSNVYISYYKYPDQVIIRKANNLAYNSWTEEINIKDSNNLVSHWGDRGAIIVKPNPYGILNCAVLWVEHYATNDLDIRYDAEWRGVNYYSISGYVTLNNVGLSDVTVTFSDIGSVTTNTSGFYSQYVPHGWSGTATPSRPGYTFSPTSRTYSNVTSNQTNQNYIVSQQTTHSISGQITWNGAGLSGVTLSFLNLGPVTTDENGFYTQQVPHNYSGSSTPSKFGFTFEPSNRVYWNLTGSITDQDYTATQITHTVSGQITWNGTGLSDVLITFTGLESVTTNTNGEYSQTVPHSYSGSATPSKFGFTFEPSIRVYWNLTGDIVNDYVATQTTYSISGQVISNGAGLDGVTITFSDLDAVMTDISGNYSQTVPHGWSGTATPSKEGYNFDPQYLTFYNVIDDMPEQDFDATSVDISTDTIPVLTTMLFVPYPNPFNPLTYISFSIDKPNHVILDVLNIAGQKVRNLSNSFYEAGKYTLIWDGNDDHEKSMPSGIYIIRMEANRKQLHQKVLLIK